MYVSRGRRISNALYFVCCFLLYYFSSSFWTFINVPVGTPSIDGVLILIYSYMFLSSHPVSSLCLWQCDFGMIILQLYDASGLVVDSLCPFASLNFSS